MLNLLRYQLLLAYRQRSELLYGVWFFLLIVSLFPLAITPEADVLQLIAPGVIWVAVLLATLLALPPMFTSDFIDGSLEHWLLSPRPAVSLVLVKVLAHWLVSAVPLLILAPLCGLILYLPSEQISVLWITLLLGTPTLSLLGAIAVALTVGLRQGGILLALLILPLYIPVLIFASSAIIATGNDLSALPHLALLAAFLLFALCLAPIVTVYALRLAVR
jgi:heme exporter protein B